MKPSVTALGVALQDFRRHLFDYIANTNKVDSQTVEDSWRRWETEMLKHENRCSQQVARYLETHHSNRTTYQTNYSQYRQSLQVAHQAMTQANLGTKVKTTENYLRTCVKPAVLLTAPSSIYTMSLYRPTSISIPEPEDEEEEPEDDEEYEEEEEEEEEEEYEEPEEEEPEDEEE